MTPEELAAARWFRSKRRPIAALAEVERAPLAAADLVVIEVTFADGGGPERYLLPLVDGREPREGEGVWASLVTAIDRAAVVAGLHGRFVAERTAAFDDLRPPHLAERRLGVEQSNTSIVVGDRLILKLYRLLEPGVTPDLEISAFLTDVGFMETPPVAGTLRYEPDGGEPAAAAMLQAFVHSRGDGWAVMLEALATAPERATAMAGEIGALTARLHVALASRPEHPAFPARVASVEETAGWRASAEGQLTQAISSVSGADHDRLIELAPAVRARFADAFGRATGDETVTRTHGDYHLGQLLARPDGAFNIVDFEGEPARPLAERRRPASPLRDVAGMLRSFDYAARTAERSGPMAAGAWLPEAREAFLAAYGVRGPLIEVFELEKACYEVRYEANNRPEWLWLPLQAIERLADG